MSGAEVAEMSASKDLGKIGGKSGGFEEEDAVEGL